MPLPRNKLLNIVPSLRNKPLLASQKSSLTSIFFHGSGLTEGMNGILHNSNDRFCVQNMLVRWPRVCRIFLSRGVTASNWTTVGPAVAAALGDVCVVMGRAAEASASQQWMREPVPSYGVLAAASIYAGDIITFVLTSGNNQAYGLSGAAPNPGYTQPYREWTEKYDRFTKASVHWYQSVSGAGGPEEIATSAVTGDIAGNTFGSLGPPLSQYGWTLSNASGWESDVVGTQTDMISRAKTFFGIA